MPVCHVGTASEAGTQGDMRSLSEAHSTLAGEHSHARFTLSETTSTFLAHAGR